MEELRRRIDEISEGLDKALSRQHFLKRAVHSLFGSDFGLDETEKEGAFFVMEQQADDLQALLDKLNGLFPLVQESERAKRTT